MDRKDIVDNRNWDRRDERRIRDGVEENRRYKR
jgi:hypothetical protein